IPNLLICFGLMPDFASKQNAAALSSAMSALGQKQTSEDDRIMSALPPKADIETQSRDVRLCQKRTFCTAERTSLFDHLVGASYQRRRHGKAKCLRGLEIDYQLEFGGLNYRQVGRLFAVENTTDVHSCLAVGIELAGSVADQSTSVRVYAIGIDRGYPMTGRQSRELFTLVDE